MIEEEGLPPIIGESAAMRRAIALAQRFAPTNLPVLLLGDTGCGKELFAQHIHRWSGRKKDMVDLNCAALPESLVEAELFGHGAEAYTGAKNNRPGLIEESNGTTLFLDEVTGLPAQAQGKLLRVLDTGEVRRVGELQKRRVEFRLLAAAQTDLAERVASRSFRRDLYQRMAGVVIELPPLSQRGEDILPLAVHFASRQGRSLELDTQSVLLRYGWPGNVRELRQAIERAGHLVENGTLPADVLAEAISLGVTPSWSDHGNVLGTVPEASQRVELVGACARYRWDGAMISRGLGIHRSTLFRRLKKHGLSLRRLRQSQESRF
jgi:DNA-binding NtrC family response regulator